MKRPVAPVLEHWGPGCAGVDEAGRGPLAGPVIAAAVILREPMYGLNDSKKMTARARLQWALRIRQEALAWSVSWAAVWEIERYNILQASLRAMSRAIGALPVRPQRIVVDGNQTPPGWQVETVVGGDGRVDAIAAASILAKVARDQTMQTLDRYYPAYGLARHMGYGTAVHLQALQRHGPCPLHRRGFGPVDRAREARQ
ncbi:ribonuclease HII [Acidithiobacillus montserratensis]|uniref:Ribonuclease HII n=1 Tax=Acidithiobacillus montserratensis TaxID=2729135 RepID=A0ACD5HCT2_9PROT|nr:ribonuclease HII [Acidithiobacillus montserratensis]MBN2680576.1 ribonuclease HII [Acidithiobacillaceae bacterium]MBU2747651.1 ribonuclease HII [Acidithiobacillus montserratensis]